MSILNRSCHFYCDGQRKLGRHWTMGVNPVHKCASLYALHYNKSDAIHMADIIDTYNILVL